MNDHDLHSRIEAVEKKLDEHIHDGIDVWKGLEGLKTDVKWIKKALWWLVGLGMSFNAVLVKYLLSHIN